MKRIRLFSENATGTEGIDAVVPVVKGLPPRLVSYQGQLYVFVPGTLGHPVVEYVATTPVEVEPGLG
jgi:hypothetical protein